MNHKKHCHSDQNSHNHRDHALCGGSTRIDYLLWGTGLILVIAYAMQLLAGEWSDTIAYLGVFTTSVFELINTMWWGIVIGIVTISLLSVIPREYVIAALGRGGSFGGIVRATLAGVALDLCSHGILMVGAKLYERGASTGQVIAFLVASPWNSLSLTLILIALVGLKWTLVFIGLSVVVAFITGMTFEILTRRGVLPENPNTVDIPEDFSITKQAKGQLKQVRLTPQTLGHMLWNGLKESRMVLRWIFFGLVLAGLIRAFVPPEHFASFFGPTLAGLFLTLGVATILEICSEGTVPVAADLLTRAAAPGNSFTFLMAGVATDYTEIMILRETTKTWKIPLFLPLIALPQIVLLGWLLNMAGAG